MWSTVENRQQPFHAPQRPPPTACLLAVHLGRHGMRLPMSRAHACTHARTHLNVSSLRKAAPGQELYGSNEGPKLNATRTSAWSLVPSLLQVMLLMVVMWKGTRTP